MKNSKKFLIYLLIIIISFVSADRLIQCSDAEVINKVIAIINDKIITYSDLMRMLYPLYMKLQKVYTREELKEKISEAREDVLNQLIENELILQEARKIEDLEISEKSVKEYVGGIIKNFPSKEVFVQNLEQEHMTMEEFEDSIRDQLLVKKLTEKEVAGRILITPKEIQEKYEKDKEKYKQAEESHVFHILIKKTGDIDQDSDQKKLLDDFSALIKDENDFTSYARKYSEGPNKDKGGDMGFLKRGTLLKELDTAIADLRAGEISEVVETDVGYHLLFLKARKKSEYIPISQIWDRIKNNLFQEKATAIRQTWIQELRNKAYIKIIDD